MLEQFIDFYVENYIIVSIALFIFSIMIKQGIESINLYLDAKSYVKKSKRKRKKKFNGMDLVDSLQKRHKKGINSFSDLRGKGKKQVRKYFKYKSEELPIIRKYSYGKLLKASNKKLIILIQNDNKTLKKIIMRKGPRGLIDASNKYLCLDEMILFLHHLPEILLTKKDYDIYLSEQDILIGYKVK